MPPKRAKKVKKPVKKLVKKLVPKKKPVANPNVIQSQNVNVIVGDVKRRQVRKKTGTKAPAKGPSMILNISNPQPLNNPYMEYFKQQLQNQQPIKATTLAEHERINEREENRASRAGALHRLDQEPNDVARELRAQGAETRARMARAEAEQKQQNAEVANSLKTPKSNKKRTPKRKTRERLRIVGDDENPFTPLAAQEEPSDEESNMLSAMEEQRSQVERVMSSNRDFVPEEEGAGTEGTPPAPTLERQRSQRGPKPSDLYTPQPTDTSESLLFKLSVLSDGELDKKLRGPKLKQYMHQLGLPNRQRGNTNPLPADQQRIAIMGLIQNFKRDKGI